MYYPNYLTHYGVQGMKWGQHLYGKDSSSGRSSRSHTSSNTQIFNNNKKKRGNTQTMSVRPETVNYLTKNKGNRETALYNARNDRSTAIKTRIKSNGRTALSVAISTTIATANPVVGVARGVGTAALMSVIDAGIVHTSYRSVINELKTTSDENIKTLAGFVNTKNAARAKR